MKKQQPPIDNSIKIDPANFVATIDNPYFPLQPGTTFTYESAHAPGIMPHEVDVVTVTHQTINILGVKCVVVSDNSYVDGKLAETTLDYYAQDKAGNVWYFGENTKELDANGNVISTEGTWLAGENGATQGIIMEASPKVGDQYDQEIAPGVAQDHARVASLNADVNVPFGSFDDVLKTKETDLLDPKAPSDYKFYAQGVGDVLEISKDTGERLELVSVSHSGPASAAVTDTFNFDALRTSATVASLPHLADLTPGNPGNHIDLHSLGASVSDQSLAGSHSPIDHTEGQHTSGASHGLAGHLTPHDFDL